MCKPCSFGYYADKKWMKDCEKCPTFMTTIVLGATSLGDCTCKHFYTTCLLCVIVKRKKIRQNPDKIESVANFSVKTLVKLHFTILDQLTIFQCNVLKDTVVQWLIQLKHA